MRNISDKPLVSAEYRPHMSHSEVIDRVDLPLNMLALQLASRYGGVNAVVVGRTKI
ncbi:hypothetical protein D3C77_385530 [compost metagenome]